MTCSTRDVQDYISLCAPKWAGPGSEGYEASLEVVPGVRRWSSGSRGRGAAARRVFSSCRLLEPSPFFSQPSSAKFQPPTPVPAVDPSVTMNPAVFLSLPDLRCSLLLLVSELGNDRPFGRLADRLLPLPRGRPCFRCFLIFSSDGEGTSPCAFTFAICLSAFQAQAPRGLRNHGRGSGSRKKKNESWGSIVRGRVVAEALPLLPEYGRCLSLGAVGTRWYPEFERTEDKTSIFSHLLPWGRV